MGVHIVLPFFHKFIKAEVISKLSSKSGLLETMRSLLDRTCPMLIDAQCVQILTEKVCPIVCSGSVIMWRVSGIADLFRFVGPYVIHR